MKKKREEIEERTKRSKRERERKKPLEARRKERAANKGKKRREAVPREGKKGKERKAARLVVGRRLYAVSTRPRRWNISPPPFCPSISYVAAGRPRTLRKGSRGKSSFSFFLLSSFFLTIHAWEKTRAAALFRGP